MNITGTTVLTVNGRSTRVCGRHFNQAVKRGSPVVLLPTGEAVIPSKGLAWSAVAGVIRSGKKVQAAIR
jgi:hypothetical protein